MLWAGWALFEIAATAALRGIMVAAEMTSVSHLDRRCTGNH